MSNTIDFLDAIKARYGLNSDYQLGKLMGWTCSRIGHYRKSRSGLDPLAAFSVAEKLDLDPLDVLTSVQIERSTDEAERQQWRRFREKLRK